MWLNFAGGSGLSDGNFGVLSRLPLPLSGCLMCGVLAGATHPFVIDFVPNKTSSKRFEAELREPTSRRSWERECRKLEPVLQGLPSLPSYLVSLILGQQRQQQQQGPVWIIIGVSFSVLTTASFPPKPCTMTSISR